MGSSCCPTPAQAPFSFLEHHPRPRENYFSHMLRRFMLSLSHFYHCIHCKHCIRFTIYAYILYAFKTLRFHWFCTYGVVAPLTARKAWCFQFHLFKGYPSLFQWKLRFPPSPIPHTLNTFNCFHMSSLQIIITVQFAIDWLYSHSSRVPIVKFPGSISIAICIHTGTEKKTSN